MPVETELRKSRRVTAKHTAHNWDVGGDSKRRQKKTKKTKNSTLTVVKLYGSLEICIHVCEV